ncbi:MAG TPA: gamma-glutamyl-gamma-aminobutyrate hydrolase family protein [Gemmatimonadaceae bacterium]|nr:gamma-glutamyl-gamma-aminobutyrate hydrolase family protein [Gemmatimonadaceae bacterium]
MTSLPSVAVTATTEIIRDVLRTRTNVSYSAAARAVGLRPYILPVLGPHDADAMLAGMHGLILTGGEDVDPAHYGSTPHPALGDVHPERDAFELALVRAARARGVPTLAICRGVQIANVALGGTLVQDLPSEWPTALAHDGRWGRSDRVHDLRVAAGSRLAEAIGATDATTNSLHHQAIARVAEGLVAVAHAPDGVVEAVEWAGEEWWMAGVQWHPEELTATPEGWDRALFAAFAAAVRARLVSSRDASAPRS